MSTASSSPATHHLNSAISNSPTTPPHTSTFSPPHSTPSPTSSTQPANNHLILSQQILDLADQVSLLNTKLVSSYDRVSNLEDQLHEANASSAGLRAKNEALQLEAAQHRQALQGGFLIEQAKVQSELQSLSEQIVLESEKRCQSEASLSSINQELDELSASLFSEANRLVANEKLQRIKAERKASEVEEAMKRVEELFDARRDHLNALRLSLEDAESKRDEYAARCELLQSSLNRLGLSQPPPPGQSPPIFSAPTSTNSLPWAPFPPLFLPTFQDALTSPSRTFCPSSCLQSSCLRSLPNIHIQISHHSLPFLEFTQFISLLRRTRSEVMARSLSTNARAHPTTSNPRLSMTTSLRPSSNVLMTSLLPISQYLSHPFLRRSIEEDLDPTLRLDLAPALNFLSRRAIQTALVEGHLIIEPVWSTNSSELETCAMCGCSLAKWLPPRPQTSVILSHSTDPPHSPSSTPSSTMRKMLGTGAWSFGGTFKRAKPSTVPSGPSVPTAKATSPLNSTSSIPPNSAFNPSDHAEKEAQYVHTFRTSETATARYPICPTYCLGRLRSACDFWTFVRSIQSGLLLDESFRFMHSLAQQTIRPSPHRRLSAMSFDSSLDCINVSVNGLHSAPALPIPSQSTSLSGSVHRPRPASHPGVPSSPTPSSSTLVPPTQAAGPSEAPVGSSPLASTAVADSEDHPESHTEAPDQPPSTSLPPIPKHHSASPTSSPHMSEENRDSSHAEQLDQKRSSDFSSISTDIAVSLASLPATQVSSASGQPSDDVPVARAIAALEDAVLPARTSPVSPPIPPSSSSDLPSAAPTDVDDAHFGVSSNRSGEPDQVNLASASKISNSASLKRATPSIRSFDPVHSSESSVADPSSPSRLESHALGESLSSNPNTQPGSVRNRTSSSWSSVEDLEAGWEGQCWNQIVKLKEEMFCKRLGIFLVHVGTS